MIYLVRIPKPSGPLGGATLRPTLRPPQHLIRLHNLQRRPALPAAPPDVWVEPDATDAPSAADESNAAHAPDGLKGDELALRPPTTINLDTTVALPPKNGVGEPQDGAASAPDRRDELREQALTASRGMTASYDEYKELTEGRRRLNTKAWITIAVAAVFIAVALTYLARSTQSDIVEVGILFFTILFLVVCVALSVLVLRVREASPRHLSGFMREMVRALERKTDEEFRASLPSFYNEHAALWNGSSEQLVAANQRKGKHLREARVFLVTAIFTAASLVVYKLITPG